MSLVLSAIPTLVVLEEAEKRVGEEEEEDKGEVGNDNERTGERENGRCGGLG